MNRDDMKELLAEALAKQSENFDEKLTKALAGQSKDLDEKLAKQSRHFDEKLTAQTERFDTRLARQAENLDEKLAVQSTSLDEKLAELAKQLDAKLEANNATLFGQLAQYFDERLDEFRTDVNSRFDYLTTTVDGLAKRFDDDDQERAALTVEQNRHGDWIGQLAKHTNTKLVPEQ